jgi:phage-related protein
MATFPSVNPTYGAQKSSAPNVRIARFGDGYEQRTTFGLNQNPKQWDLTWNVSETDADTIETFLDARAADGASFEWTPLGESTEYNWVCEQWSKSIPYLNRATITATFRQVFEP